MIRANGEIGKCTVNLNDIDNRFGNINDIDLKKFTLDSLVYNHSSHLKRECIQCCIYPICFGRQCPARSRQKCAEAIREYQLMVKSFFPEATVIPLKWREMKT